MATSRKLCLLALDAANPALVRRWVAEGVLPNVAQLMARGLVGDTRSVEGLFVGATWPSFYTGHDPANHGLYWLDRLQLGSYRVLRGRPSDFGRRAALWEVVSGTGRRVVVLDVPLSRMSPGLNGVQVVEWGVHDAAFGFQASPRSLKREILRTVGPHPAPASCDAPRRSMEEYREFAEQLMRGAAARAHLTRNLLASEEWDFAIQVFSETHCAGHQLWHFHDSTHPGFDMRAVGAIGDLVRDVYVAVDRAVGDIVSNLGPDVTIVLLALHGMSHACGSSLLLPEILSRLGVTVYGAGSGEGEDRQSGRGPARALLRVYHRLPERIRGPIYRFRQHANQRWLGRGTPVNLVPAKSKAFFIGLGTGSLVSGVRLNLQGREPAGTLAPGPEAQSFSSELIHELLAATNPETGRPLVDRVVSTADLYHGPYLDELPDLLVVWDEETRRGTTVAGSGAGAVWRAISPRLGAVAVTNSYCRTGEHRIEGMFIATGPGIAPGKLNRVVSVLDFAPTFAKMCGTEMPSSDGKVISELL